MKVIEQDVYKNVVASVNTQTVLLDQDCGSVYLDKQGAQQLIKVLQEFVDEN